MMNADFPALESSTTYLDSAATTQSPIFVLNSVYSAEIRGRANVHRGLYPWAERATLAYESARQRVASFVGALPEQLVFTRSATESLNLTAHSLASDLGPGDEVVLSRLEHHANILPWTELARIRNFKVKLVDTEHLSEALTSQTKVVAITHASNVTGEVLPVREVVKAAHAVGALVVLDAAQTVGHIPLHFNDLGVDAMAFSAHKMYGPMGIGALVATSEVMKRLRPLIYGGGIVDDVDEYGRATYRSSPALLEPGTPNITGAIGFAAAVEWLSKVGMKNIESHETELIRYLDAALAAWGTEVVGRKSCTIGIAAFTAAGVHAHDVAEILGREGICVRAGHLCAAPFVKSIAPEGLVRVSLGVYSEKQDVDRLIQGLYVARRLFD